MRTRWILAADSSRARIFKVLPKNKLEELESLIHPESRLPDKDRGSDRPGRLSVDRGGERQHGLEPSSDPKRQEAINFSRIVAASLDKARSLQKYQELVIIAAPSFLGLLREQLSKQVEQCVIREISKNLATLSPAEIQEHLKKDF
jgi:protein required for attachment to host cells